MNEKKPSMVLVCLKVEGAAHVADYLDQAEQQFLGCGPDHFTKISDSVFLVNQDECYPALVKLIGYCNQSKNNPGSVVVKLMIAELAESPVVLSPSHQDVRSSILKMGRQVRLTKHEEPSQ